MKKTSESSFGHDRDQRRLLERLSGWRLIAFFAILGLNLIGLIFMSVFVLVPNPRWQAAFIGLASSQSALFAIAIGAFRFRISVKLIFLVVHLTACLWAIRQFTSMAFNTPVIIDSFFSIGTQSLLICGVASLSGANLSIFQSLPRRLEFRIRDLLIMTTVIGVSIPTLQFFLPNLDAISNTNPKYIALSCGKGLVHALWCATLLSCFVKGSLPPKIGKRDWASRLCQTACLLIVVLFLEAGFKILDVESFAAWDRFAFAIWLSLSFIPVAGLTSESPHAKWVTMTEFYTRVQRQNARIKRSSSTNDSACVSDPRFPVVDLSRNPDSTDHRTILANHKTKPRILNSSHSSATSGSDSSKRAVATGTRSNNPLVE